MSSQQELERNIKRQNEINARNKAEKERKKRILLSCGKWVADNIVAIGAWVVALIALIRTF